MLPIEHKQIKKVRVTQICHVSYEEKAERVFITNETKVIDVVADVGSFMILLYSLHFCITSGTGVSHLLSV